MTTTPQNPLLIDNPLLPATRTGTLDLKTPTVAYQLNLKGSTNCARISLTDLTGNADVRVLNAQNNVISTSTPNTGNAAEAILLNQLPAGTYTVEVALAADAGLASYKLNVIANSDAQLSNLLWRNLNSGDNIVWTMYGRDRVDNNLLTVPADWSIQARADLDGDGEEDLIWRNQRSGQVAFWALKNGAKTIDKVFNVSLDWQILAVNDFNGDGRADLLWRNTGTGQLIYWTLKNNLDRSDDGDSRVPRVGLDWQIDKTADVNGDGKADLIWRNVNSGTLAIWLSGTNTNWNANYAIDKSWQVQTTGDLNNDGKTDLIWRNVRSGEVAIWLMNNTATSNRWIANAPLDWSIQQVGNFDGQGGDDLLWRNSNGSVAVWLIASDGLSKLGDKVFPSMGASWQIAGVGDFNQDGKTDIVYRNNDQATARVVLMNGLNELESRDYQGIDRSWQLQGVIKRQVLPFPFNLNDGTVANAFNIGQLNGKAQYSDRVRKGVTQYYKFNVSLQSKINLSAIKGNVTLELFNTPDGTNLGSKIASGATVEAGTYLISVTTQSDSAIDYALEAEGLPNSTDLQGTRFEVLPSSNIQLIPSSQAGSKGPNIVDAKFSIRNSGGFKVTSFDVGFRISRDSNIDPRLNSPDPIVKVLNEAGTDYLDVRTINQELKAGETLTLNVKLRLPDTLSNFWLADGKYYIGAVVDPNGSIQEINEGNNYNTGIGLDEFETVIRGTETVELVGSELTVLSGNFAPGGSLTVRYAIQNIGNKPVPSGLDIPMRFYLSTDPNIVAGSDDYLVRINDASTIEDYISSSNLGGATNGTPTTVVRQITLLLPTLDKWAGWNAGKQFYLGDWIYTDGIPVGEQDSLNNKINPTSILPTDPSTDTIGKNYVILNRS